MVTWLTFLALLNAKWGFFYSFINLNLVRSELRCTIKTKTGNYIYDVVRNFLRTFSLEDAPITYRTEELEDDALLIVRRVQVKVSKLSMD
ncbi:hypothetical protein [Liquorilactobacillus oeni]|uniref:hypothetical protein n=1 Tax=Liquorilactobacillus oeni TaxID=303241 RepID=UPI001F31B9A4|nr:hypothetical protein [Liquorilactobacillus oeni]